MNIEQTILDFAKIAFGAFITIFNVWILFTVTEIKNDIRELRGWLVNKMTKPGEPSDFPQRRSRLSRWREEKAGRD